MPKYEWKMLAEAGWFALVAVVVVALEALVKFNPDTIDDWQTYGIALGGAAVRAAAGALLAAFTKPTA